MPAIHILRDRLGLTRSYRPNQVVTKAIRSYIEDGDAFDRGHHPYARTRKQETGPSDRSYFLYLKIVRDVTFEQVIEMD